MFSIHKNGQDFLDIRYAKALFFVNFELENTFNVNVSQKRT